MSEDDKNQAAQAAADAENGQAPEGQSAEGEKSYEELKAEAEKLEAENKTLKQQKDEGEKTDNQKVRLQKAQEENERLKGNGESGEPAKPEAKQEQDIDPDDLYSLRDAGYKRDSEEAELLKTYKDAGLIGDYESGLEDSAVQAKLEEIKANREARDVVDENDQEKVNLNTTQETISRYESSGDVPEDAHQRDKLAEANVDKMNL